MGAASRKLQQVGNVPDEFLRDGDFERRLANAALQLAEPQLTCHGIRSARLKYIPALAAQPTREKPQQRGLSDERLSRNHQRTRHALLQRRCRGRQRLLPSLGLDQDLVLAALGPETAECASGTSRSTLVRCISSSCASRPAANGWFTRSRNARIVAGGDAKGICSALLNEATSPSDARRAK